MITFQVQINSTGTWTDRTSHVVARSITRTEVLSREASSLVFAVNTPANTPKPWAPAVNDAIKLIDNDGTTVLFKGTITSVNRLIDGMLVTFNCTAKDQTHKLDALTVLERYTNKTVNYIVDDILTKYAPTFSDAQVSCTEVMETLNFNDLKPSECFNKIAGLLGNYVWYCDYDDTIHFFKKYTRPAPYSLGEKDDTFVGNSLTIKRNIDQLRNSIYVRGGTVEGNTVTEQKTADGVQKIFFIGYNLNSTTLVVKLATVTQTVGIDGVDDPSSKQVLYNATSGLIKFTATPTAGQVVEWSGKPIYNIKVLVEDATSIGKYGRRQFRIVDESIKSSETAKRRARAELTKYAERVNEGGFKTTKSGLRVGQELRIYLPTLAIDEYFTITRITTRVTAPTLLEHDVAIVASETLNTVDVLTKLLVNEPADSIQATDEILTYALYYVEEVIVSDTFTATVRPSGTPTFADSVGITDNMTVNPWGNVNDGFIAVFGNYTPSNPITDRKRNGLIGVSFQMT